MGASEAQGLYWFLGVLIPALTAAFGFTHVRIAQARDDMKADLNNTRAEFDKRFHEGREDRDKLWNAMQKLQEQTSLQHQQILDRVGLLATRDDLHKDRQLMEQRLSGNFK